MKTVPPALAAHMDGEVTTLAQCWKLTRRDGVVLGFTDHDRDLVVDGQDYLATTGVTPSAVSASAALKVDELDIEGMLDSEAIRQEDILDGKYDFAELELFLVNYEAPGDGVLVLRTGWLGEVTLKGEQFVAEVRGLTQALQQTIGEIYSATCRADFTDDRCKLDAEDFTFSGEVSAVDGVYSFRAGGMAQGDGYFSHGRVRFTSGANAGLSVLIKEYVDKTFYTALPMRVMAEVGDGFEAIAGCDKLHTTCRVRFNNLVNFRGEPHVPGTDKLLETSATRSNWS